MVRPGETTELGDGPGKADGGVQGMAGSVLPNRPLVAVVALLLTAVGGEPQAAIR